MLTMFLSKDIVLRTNYIEVSKGSENAGNELEKFITLMMCQKDIDSKSGAVYINS